MNVLLIVPGLAFVLIFAIWLGELNPNRNADLEPQDRMGFIDYHWPNDVQDYCSRLNATGHDCNHPQRPDPCHRCRTMGQLEAEWYRRNIGS
jgi:hypothetical protein